MIKCVTPLIIRCFRIRRDNLFFNIKISKYSVKWSNDISSFNAFSWFQPPPSRLLPHYFVVNALFFSRSFNFFSLPLYFIAAILSFCCYLNAEGNIKWGRKSSGEKIIKWRKQNNKAVAKNMDPLGMVPLGFRQ